MEMVKKVVMRKGFAMGIVVLVVLASFVGIISTVSAGNNNGRNPDSVMDDEDVLHMVWQEPVGKGMGPTEIVYANNRWTEKGQGNMGIGNDKNPTKQILSNTPYTFSVNPSIEQTEEGWLHVKWTEKLSSGDEEVELWSADGGMNWLESPPPLPWMRVGNYFEFETEIVELENMTENNFSITYVIDELSKDTIGMNQKYGTIEFNTTFDIHSRKLLYIEGEDVSDLSSYYSWLWVTEEDIISGDTVLTTISASLTDPYVVKSPPTAEFTISFPNIQSRVYYQLESGILYNTIDNWNIEGINYRFWSNLTDTGHISIKELYPSPPTTNADFAVIFNSYQISPTPNYNIHQYYYPPYQFAGHYYSRNTDTSGYYTSAYATSTSSASRYSGKMYANTDAHTYIGGGLGTAEAQANAGASMMGYRFTWNHATSFSQFRLRAKIDGSSNAYASLAGWWGASRGQVKLRLEGTLYDTATGYTVASTTWTFDDYEAYPFGIPRASKNWNIYRNFNMYSTLYNGRKYRFIYNLHALSFATCNGIASSATAYSYMTIDISYFRIAAY